MFIMPRAVRPVPLWIAAWATLLASTSTAQTTLELTVSAGKHNRTQCVVRVPVQVPRELLSGAAITLHDENDRTLPGQLTAPRLLSAAADDADGTASAELYFVLPELGAGRERRYRVEIRKAEAGRPGFRWADEPGRYATLSFADGTERAVLRYMYEAPDDSSDARRMETYKVFHHLYDPRGERLVTKGPGGLFPHHRGLFYGFNKIRYGDKQADIWHCNRGESQTHEAVLASEAGPVLGRHRVRVDWHGRDDAVFAEEQRELTAYHLPGGLLVEFASRLESRVGALHLDGDPQHAGFQFRASQEVPDRTKKLTYYLRPDGPGEPGRFRNWPQDAEHVDLPWNALSFVLGDQRYTCCYLDRPENPKPARFSERDYGRFGSYFVFDADADRPVELNYRIWLQEGTMTVGQVQQLSDAFTTPPKVRVSR